MAPQSTPTPPLFSVITVCFNACETIQDTINSVYSQKGVSLEHIIIDGGSNDGTLDIVESQKEKFSVVISEPDNGVYEAMQKGLLRAKGKYTGFLNADDFFASSDSLAKLARPLSQTQGKIIGLTGGLDQIDGNGLVKRKIGYAPFKPRNIQWGKFPPHPTTYFMTDLMQNSGGFDNSFKIAGDFDMFLKILPTLERSPTNTLGHVTDTIVKMRIGGISTTGFSSYVTIGRENSLALKKNGFQVDFLKMHLRGFRKAFELIN